MVIDCVHTICLKATSHELPKLEHLDFAIKESCDMKIQMLLERALRHKEILKAQVVQDRIDGREVSKITIRGMEAHIRAPGRPLSQKKKVEAA